MAACMRPLLIAALAIAASFFAAEVRAYPASDGYKAQSCPNGFFTAVAPSIAEACASIPSENGKIWANAGSACSVNNNFLSWSYTGVSGTTCVGNSQVFSPATQQTNTFPKNGGVAVAAKYCPNGGTLSGNNCVCPEGYTDTGSACNPPSGPAACPEGQFRELSDSACVEKCPLDQGNGQMEYPAPGSRTDAICGQRVKLGGLGVMDYQGNEILCQYAGTGVTVCADTGGGMMCLSERTYNLGKTCTTETDVPPDSSPCSAGDLYCDKNGACPAGFNAGDFNGRSLCVKAGEPVETVPRSKSPLDPPKDPPLPPAPNPLVDSETGTSEPNPEVFDSVVNVGDKAVKGGGGGAGGGEEIVTCGLPNTPKCKIDETGTPTAGNFADATKALDDAKNSAVEGLTTVTSAQGKQTTWGWNLALPTGCTALTVDAIFKTFTINPCPYMGVMHDLMSMVWAAVTLFFVFGLVGRTLREA